MSSCQIPGRGPRQLLGDDIKVDGVASAALQGMKLQDMGGAS